MGYYPILDQSYENMAIFHGFFFNQRRMLCCSFHPEKMLRNHRFPGRPPMIPRWP